MIGYEVIIKIAPILAVLAGGFVGYGELKSQINSVQELQIRQYDQIIHQLDRLEDKIDKKADK